MVRSSQVMCYGIRTACDPELVETLRARLLKARLSKASWTEASWAAAVDKVRRSRQWAAHTHGGNRLYGVSGKRLSKKAKAAAKPAAATAAASGDAAVPVVDGTLPSALTAGGEADEAAVPVVDGTFPHAAVEVVNSAGARPFGVLRFIAKGSYGRVYKAVHNKTGILAAIKVVDLDGQLASFQERELAALKRLRGHPNIVSLDQATVELFTLELVFEYCDTNLHEFIQQRRFAKFASVSGMRAAFTHQLFEGLRFVHSHRIVHRDIKPANVLIARGCAAASPAQFCLKIVDFGLVRTLPAVGDDDPVGVHLSGGVFARYYRPIEVLLGSPSYGTAADVWSASCTCGEMCLEAPIFPGNTSSEMLAKIIREVGIPSASRWPALAAMPRFAQVMEAAHKEKFPLGGRFAVLRQCASAIGDKYFAFLRATLEPVPSVRWIAADVWSADLR